MAVFINLDFSFYYMPTGGEGSEFAERIKANNEQADAIQKLWEAYQEHEASATKLLGQDGLKGIRYFDVQDKLAATINCACEIIEKESLLFDSANKLLNEMAAKGVISYAICNRHRVTIHDNHLVCANFATRIKKHLQRTLFIDLQIG